MALKDFTKAACDPENCYESGFFASPNEGWAPQKYRPRKAGTEILMRLFEQS
jgi:hypothetical protein